MIIVAGRPAASRAPAHDVIDLTVTWRRRSHQVRLAGHTPSIRRPPSYRKVSVTN